MTKMKKVLQLEDDILDGVSGGIDFSYGMDGDPLLEEFTLFWNANKDNDSGSVTDSRAEFMNAFRQWVSDGVPNNIPDWYRSYTDGKG